MILSRRTFLQTTAAVTAAQPQLTYENHARGIRILPGQWRPHYPWEHIAWVSPPWPSQDYLWLDFPEAIFINRDLIFLSHINPSFPAFTGNLPAMAWRKTENGITFERELPSGVRFGSSVTRQSETIVALKIRLHNGSKEPLHRISLQTCAYLRAIREFAAFTNSNKYIHLPQGGWTSGASSLPKEGTQPYRVGWRHSGAPIADLPVMVTLSSAAQRLVAMTWHTDTLSLVANPMHPCFHADPKFKDLEPGESAAIHGHLIFFEGHLEDFRYSDYA